MTAQRYRKIPVEIEAAQWDGTAEGATPLIDWMLTNDTAATYRCADPDRCEDNDGDSPHTIAISTLEGTMTASLGDWIIKGIKGEFYPCRGDIFAATYEPADAPQVGPQGAAPVPAPRAQGGSIADVSDASYLIGLRSRLAEAGDADTLAVLDRLVLDLDRARAELDRLRRPYADLGEGDCGAVHPDGGKVCARRWGHAVHLRHAVDGSGGVDAWTMEPVGESAGEVRETASPAPPAAEPERALSEYEIRADTEAALDAAGIALAQAEDDQERAEAIGDLLADWYQAWPPSAVTDPHQPIAAEIVRLLAETAGPSRELDRSARALALASVARLFAGSGEGMHYRDLEGTTVAAAERVADWIATGTYDGWQDDDRPYTQREYAQAVLLMRDHIAAVAHSLAEQADKVPDMTADLAAAVTRVREVLARDEDSYLAEIQAEPAGQPEADHA